MKTLENIYTTPPNRSINSTLSGTKDSKTCAKQLCFTQRVISAALLVCCTGCHTQSLAYDDSFDCKNVVSYYWPIDNVSNQNTQKWSIENVSTVDLLTDDSHGDLTARDHWRKQSVDFASRVHPFRFFDSVSENLKYFEDNITVDKILSIDELVGQQWTKEQLDNFLYILSIFKDKHPNVKLILWDASSWLDDEVDYAAAVYSNVDLVLIQHYSNDLTKLEDHIQSLDNKLSLYREILSKNTKVGVAIGINPSSSEKSIDGSITWAERQMIETANYLDTINIETVGLYAPVYLSTKALDSLNKIYSAPEYADCKLFKQ